MKKFNKIISGALAALMIFTSVPVYAVNDVSTGTNTEISTETEENTSETISNGTEEIIDLSEISTQETATTENPVIEDKPTVFVESDENLEETDNWELGLVFYDSTVENGTKPLTEINWDASDGGNKKGTPRIITVQINYRNTNTVTTYQPGALKIAIPNIVYGNTYNKDNSAFWEASVNIGANDSTHKNYQWNFNDGKSTPSISSQYYYFYNAETIEEKSNFEGTIQIEYTIAPAYENPYLNPETYQDKCTHATSQNITYKLSYKKNLDNSTTEDISLSSNSISLNYSRTYIHIWEKLEYTVTKKADKISSYDGLGENAMDYIWVKYSFYSRDDPENVRYDLKYTASSRKFYDKLPEECIVYDKNGNLMAPTEENTYIFDWKTSNPLISRDVSICTFYVGYPKSIYNEQNNNLEIINNVDMYGDYKDGNGYIYLNSDTLELNLSNYEFNYSGELYSIKKEYPVKDIDEKQSPFCYQDIINGEASLPWRIYPDINYIGKELTARVGDDLLYIADENGNRIKLNDDEYYFSSITIPAFYNGNNVISKDYTMDIYVRYANEQEYKKFGETIPAITSSYLSKTITFPTDKKVVGFYIEFNNINESIKATSIKCQTIIHKTNATQTGTLYNFSYLQVFTEDENGNLVLQNEATESNYSTEMTKMDIASYDKQTYGKYLQRDYANVDWEYFTLNFGYGISATKSFSSITQDNENELFFGSTQLSAGLSNPTAYDSSVYLKFFNQLGPDDEVPDIVVYDLFPEGMEITSSAEEILNNLTTVEYAGDETHYQYFYDSHRNKVFENREELESFIKENTQIEIIENWNNTKRTMFKATTSLKKYKLYYISISTSYTTSGGGFTRLRSFSLVYNINYNISYDSFLEKGKTFTNNIYSELKDFPINKLKSPGTGTIIYDNGTKDPDVYDINQNNITDEYLTYNNASVNISYIISTHQDLQVSTISTLSNYSTGTIPAEYGKDYSYKLRVRTGQNDVTNLIIYDNLEKWTKDKDGNFIEAAGDKKYWQGEFQGIDTSYAESKGYTVKVWYSENEKAGTLAQDFSWQEYSDSVDKAKVKSLAFQYLDSEGNPAVLPANSLTYVEINMRAPADESIKTLAYNGCWTQWNAIDEFGQTVDFITGINSNIVKVALPNSVIENEIPSIQLNIEKEIQGTTEAFENMQLDPNREYQFKISLVKQEENETVPMILLMELSAIRKVL